MKEIDNKIKQAIMKKAEFGVLQGVREFRKGQTGKRITFFYSKKNNALMPCEGDLEAAHCLHMEFDNSISNYRVQPFQLNWNGFKYTPDALIIHVDKTVSLREVKPSEKYATHEIKSRLDEVSIEFRKNNIPFSVYTEIELQTEPDYYNRLYLYRAVRAKIPTYDLDSASQLLLDQRGDIKTISDAKLLISGLDLHPLVIEQLLFDGFYTFNPKKKVALNTGVKLK